MPLVTDTEEPPSQKRSLRCPILERLILVDEDVNKETEEQGNRAQKRRRQDSSTSTLMEVSSKGYLSHEQGVHL